MPTLGSAWISVGPSGFAEFAATAQAGITAALKGVDATVNVGADTSGALTKLAAFKAALAAVQKTISTIKVGVDDSAGLAKLASFQARMNAITAAVADLRIDADDTAATAKIAALEAQAVHLARAMQDMTLGVDITAAATKILAITAQIKLLQSDSASVTIDANILPLEAKLLALQASLSSFSDTTTGEAIPALSNLGVAGLLTAGWLGGLQGKVQLFAGVLTEAGIPAWIASATALHLIADSALEISAELIPAGLALAAFGIGAAPVIGDIYTQMTNVFNVSRALNENIYPLTGGFQSLAKAVQPEVYSLFGDALVIVGKNLGGITQLAQSTGKVLDDLATRITAALTSGSLDSLIKNGPADVAQLGDIVGNIFGTIGNVLKVLPGYAQDLFGALDAVTKALEAVTANPFVQWVLGAGIAVHGFILWAGLAGTAAVVFGNALIGLGIDLGLVAAGTTAFDASEFVFGLLTAFTAVGELGGALLTLAGSETIAAAATGALGGLLDALGAISPFVWVAAAIGGLVALGLALTSSGSGLNSFDSSLNTLVSNSSLTDFGTSISGAIGTATASVNLGKASITSLTNQLDNLPTSLTNANAASGRFGAAMDSQSAQAQALAAQLNTQNATLAENQNELSTLKTYQANYASLLATAHGNLSLLNAAGITSNDLMTTSKSKMADLTLEVQAQVDAQKALALGTGESAAGLNAMNIPLKENQAALQTMITAESSLLGIITGGQSAFNDFQQSIQGTTAKFVSPSGLADAFTLAGGNLTGLNQQSLAFSNTLYTQSIPALQTLIGNLQKQGISQTNLSTVVATGAGQMLQYTGNNTEANSVIVALINNALGPATVSLGTLKGWVDKNSTSLTGMSNIVASSTVKASTLATTLNTDLTAAFQKSLFNASGAQGAIDLMTKAIVNQGTGSDAFKSARQTLIQDLEKTGLSATDAKNYVKNLQDEIDALHGKTVTVATTLTGEGGLVASATGFATKTFNLTTIPAAAKGMKVPGSGNSDSFHAMLTPGEVVVPKGMVAAGAVDHLRGKLPGFAGGGLADASPWTGQQAAGDVQAWDVAAVSAWMQAAVAAQAAAAEKAAQQFISTQGASGGIIQAMFATLAAQRGWTGPQLTALLEVESREAGFNMTATNPSSGAYGLAQFIGGPGEYALFGGNSTTANGQITAMLNYISDRYSNPENAWAHEVEYGWYGKGGKVALPKSGSARTYDSGGWLPTGASVAVNNTGSPEYVTPSGGGKMTAGETAVLQRLDALISVCGQQGTSFGRVVNNTARTASYGSYSGRR